MVNLIGGIQIVINLSVFIVCSYCTLSVIQNMTLLTDKDKATTRSLLVTLLVLCTAPLFEAVFSRVVANFALYWIFKCSLIFFCMLPQINGGDIIYKSYILPFLDNHSGIDGAIANWTSSIRSTVSSVTEPSVTPVKNQ